jgi:Na+/H+ antiporter NhaD/arsenite permease-like protein
MSSYYLHVDEDEEAPLKTTPPRKRAAWKSSRAANHWLSFLTWSRLKIFVILTLLILAIYLFTTEETIQLENLNLRGISATEPLMVILTPEFTSPIKVLECRIRVQEVDDAEKLGLNVTVLLQHKNPHSDEWSLFGDPSVIKITSDGEANFKHDYYVDEDSDPAKFLVWAFLITTNSPHVLGITFEVFHLPAIVRYQVIFAALVLLAVYILIIFELVHRTIAAMLGAFVGLAILSKIHQRPSLAEVISWVDFETCGLLFGMMVMVGIFSQTGFFEWSAVKAYKMSKGNLWRLVSLLSIFTAVVSAFLDNVTTILLLVPVTMRLCKVLDINPTQILLTLVMYSNLGGTATPVGDPPNIIIVNDSKIAASGFVNFGNFTAHMMPGVILSSMTCYFLLKRLVVPSLRRQPNLNQKQEIEIWKKTLSKMRAETEEEQAVKKRMSDYVAVLEKQIREAPPVAADIDISELEEKYKIHDIPLFINSCVILSVVILLFFLHTAIHVELTLAWIAIIGAIAHLLSSGIHDIEEVLEKVEFGTLMFFAALFVLMETLEQLGLIEWIGEETAAIIESVPEGNSRLVAAVCLLIWVSAIVSAFIDNIPFTAAMVPVVYRLHLSKLPLTPLLWALAFGTCFGGNGTLIGASANVVTAGLAESQGYPIRFATFLKTGLPVMLLSVFTANIYLLIFHVAVPWHEGIPESDSILVKPH